MYYLADTQYIYTTMHIYDVMYQYTINTLCPKSPSVRGLVACLPVRLLFKSTKHNAFYPV